MSVFVDKVGSYETDVLTASMKKAFSELGITPTQNSKIVLKPNIVGAFAFDSAAVTNPRLVGTLIEYLRESKVEDITVCEGPGVGQDVDKSFEVSGYKKMCKRHNVPLVDLNSSERVEVPWGLGKIRLPKIICESDYYINIPKVKTHGQTQVTLALKNQKGLLLSQDKKRFHMEWGLHKPIVELAKVISPNLNIVDGVIGMEGEGPLRGGKIKSGFMVYGKNIVEVDAATAMLMELKPENIEHIRLGLAENPILKEFQVKGCEIKDLKKTFQNANQQFGHVLNIYSWRNPYACSMCIQSFSEAISLAVKNPRYWTTKIPKLAYYALLGRLHIVQGKNACIPPLKGRVICFGDCTRELSRKGGYTWIPGCPPKKEEVLEKL